jgi:hypothetical protein
VFSSRVDRDCVDHSSFLATVLEWKGNLHRQPVIEFEDNRLFRFVEQNVDADDMEIAIQRMRSSALNSTER